jgi:hypothetical protein
VLRGVGVARRLKIACNRELTKRRKYLRWSSTTVAMSKEEEISVVAT